MTRPGRFGTRTRPHVALLLLVAVGLGLGACNERRRIGVIADASLADGESRSDAASPSGMLTLTVHGATWAEGRVDPDRDDLILTLELSNSPDGSVASLSPELFTMQTMSGVEVVGVYAYAVSMEAQACSADLAVSAGGRTTCAVAFRVPSGEAPSRVTYREPDGRTALADLPVCAPGVPAGLCPRQTTCADGVCRNCVAVDSERNECINCITGVGFDACGYPPESCADPSGCVAACATAGETSCTCVGDPSCSGCEGQVVPYMECIAAACPGCAG